MPPQEFAHWKQKTLLGVSLKVIAPTGQYDGTKLINWVINRWAFKPELGYSRRLGNWLLDGYGGAWLYTTNSTAFAGPAPGPKTQEPIGSLEATLATTSDNAPGSRLMAISGGAASRASAV
jgi:Putative MetA-pathway of phenol degradation